MSKVYFSYRTVCPNNQTKFELRIIVNGSYCGVCKYYEGSFNNERYVECNYPTLKDKLSLLKQLTLN